MAAVLEAGANAIVAGSAVFLKDYAKAIEAFVTASVLPGTGNGLE